MGRRKDPAPVPPVVSVAVLVDELVRSHEFVADVEMRKAHAETVREVAASMGVTITVADWLPSMTPEEAETVLAHVVAPHQRIEDLAELDDLRERELRDAQRARGEWPMTPAEKIRIFGVDGMHLAEATQGAASGPADGPNAIDQEIGNHYTAKIANSLFAAQVFPND